MSENHVIMLSEREFKSRCMELLDEVNQSGKEVIISRAGMPLARLGPLKNSIHEVRRSMRIEIHEDIVSPLDTLDWGSLV